MRASTLPRILLGLAALLLASSPSAAETKAEGLVREGFELIGEQRFEPASRKFEKALKIGGVAFDPTLGLAIACNRLKRYDKAVETAARATQLASSDRQIVQANNQLGIATFNQLRDASEQQVARRRKGSGLPARAAWEERDWSVPEKAFRRVLELAPQHFAVARLNLAQVLGYQQRYPEAIAELELFEASDPPTPPLHVQQAIDSLRCFAEAALEAPEKRPLRLGAQNPNIVAPRKVSAPQPQYPALARAANTQGAVILETIVDRNGDVACVQVLMGLPHGLSESAVEAAHNWKFEPATRGGSPVAVFYELAISFRQSQDRSRDVVQPVGP